MRAKNSIKIKQKQKLKHVLPVLHFKLSHWVERTSLGMKQAQNGYLNNTEKKKKKTTAIKSSRENLWRSLRPLANCADNKAVLEAISINGSGRSGRPRQKLLHAPHLDNLPSPFVPSDTFWGHACAFCPGFRFVFGLGLVYLYPSLLVFLPKRVS